MNGASILNRHHLKGGQTTTSLGEEYKGFLQPLKGTTKTERRRLLVARVNGKNSEYLPTYL